MLFDERPVTFDRFIRYLASAALILGLVWLLNYLSDAILPFAVALVLAYLLNPLVSFLQKKIKIRALAILLTLTGLAALLFLAFRLAVPLMASEVQQAGQLLSELLNNSEMANRIAQMLPEDLWKEVRGALQDSDLQAFLVSGEGLGLAKTAVKKIMPGIWGVLSGAGSLLAGIAGLTVILLYLVFLLLDYDAMTDSWLEYIPRDYRDSVCRFTDEFTLAMNRYFRAQAAIAATVGVLFAIGFGLIGLPLGVLLGLTLGLFNMVPYLQLAGIPPAIFLALLHAAQTGQNAWAILGLTALVFGVVQLIQDALLTPRIMGGITGLSPAIILLSLSIWGKVLGLLGLIIAIPATCLCLVYYRRLIGAA